MKLKEHLQFLLMLIPTVLLLIAAAVTLAAPASAEPRPSRVSQEAPVLR